MSPTESAPPNAPRRSRGPALRADGLLGRIAVAAAVWRSRLRRWLGRQPARTPGELLRRPVLAHLGGVALEIRPACHDLDELLPTGGSPMRRYFHPGPGEVVVEVGARSGLHALLAGERGARVVALEPNPELARRFERNLARNPRSTISLRPIAAGPWPGRARLSVRAGPERRTLEVPVEPLDSVVSAFEPGGPVHWLLLEAPGSEAPILEGARQTLERTEQLLLELADTADRELCRSRLARAGLLVRARERAAEGREWWWAVRALPAGGEELPGLTASFAS